MRDEGSAPMHRFFGLLALTAAGLGVWLLFSGPDSGSQSLGANALREAPVAYGGWALGLLMGLALAWLATFNWKDLPARLTAWVRLQRRRLGWAIVGSFFAAILLLF
jgi:hypothetical protein